MSVLGPSQPDNDQPSLIDGWELSARQVHALVNDADAQKKDSSDGDGSAGGDDGGDHRGGSDERVVLLDCRTPQEHKVASIDGAMLVPMEEIRARLSELDEFADRPIVVLCHVGQRSMAVTSFLREQGFEDVWSMAGGIDAWSRLIDTTIPRY